MSFALHAAIELRKQARIAVEGEMTSEVARIVCQAEHACAALSPMEYAACNAWCWDSLTPEQAAEIKAMCRPRGDA